MPRADDLDRSLNTHDYGISGYLRYLVYAPFFVQGDLEYLSFQAFQIDGEKVRNGYTSVLLGGGVGFPVSAGASSWLSLQYNVTYSDDDIFRPYNSPWVFRAGVGFGI